MTSNTISDSPQLTKKEMIAEKIAKLKVINEERPCSECVWHNAKNGYYSCDAAIGSCNFEHNRFTRASKDSRKV